MTGLLNPRSSKFQSCVALFFGVYLSHGIVHRVALLFSSKISFWVRYRAPQLRSLRKKEVHLYRSMPQKARSITPGSCAITPGNTHFRREVVCYCTASGSGTIIELQQFVEVRFCRGLYNWGSTIRHRGGVHVYEYIFYMMWYRMWSALGSHIHYSNTLGTKAAAIFFSITRIWVIAQGGAYQ